MQSNSTHNAYRAVCTHAKGTDLLCSATADAPPPSFPPTSQASFCQFESVTADDITAAVRALPNKSCALDPLPTAQLKAIVDLIAPFLAHMFNKSLMSGSVPEVFKSAFITPRLKKSNMDPADAKSYRPTSNLPVASITGATGGSAVTPTPQSVRSVAAVSVRIPCLPLDRDRRVEGSD